MEKAKTFSEYLEKNSSSGQKETKTRRKTRSYSEYQTYRDLTDGTLNRDLEDLNKALNELDAGWKDASSLEETKKRLSGIVTRLSSAKQYVTDYGEGEDSVKSVADAYQAYADILNGFGDIQSYYSQFANADAYDKYMFARDLDKYKKDMMSADDFGYYSKLGANIKNPSWEEAQDHKFFGIGRDGAPIQNIVTFSRDNIANIGTQTAQKVRGGGGDITGDYRYANIMDDDEASIYNYLLAKENAGQLEQGTAAKFLENMDGVLTEREGGKIFSQVEGSTAQELLFGFCAGIDQFGQGIKNAFNMRDDTIAPTSMQIAAGLVREDLADTGGKFLGSSLGQIGYDTASTIGNMFPSILLSAVTGGTAGPIVGVSAMGLSAAGNSYQELLNSGMNKGQARALSTVLGVWEGASEYFLGRIGGLSGDFVGKALGKTKLVKGLQSSANGITRALLRFFDQFVIDPVQEGLEEVIQDIGSTAINAIFTGEWDFSSAEELAYSFTLGALSAAVMNAPTNLVSNTVNDIGTYRQGKNIIDVGGVDALKNLAVETAKESGENSTLGKYAENVAKKPTPTNVGILDQKINEAKNENNRRSIEKALIDQMTEDGVSAKKAKRAAAKLSEILLEDYNGGEVDLKKAMKNPSVKKVYDKVVKGEGSEIAKRDAHHTEVREGIIRDYFEGKIEKSEMDKSLSEKFSFTDDGETINTKTGEKITLAARDTVVSNEDGNLTLKLENGETVRASDISFSSKGEAVLYSVIADMGVGADTANTLLADALETDGKSMISVAFGIRDAYWYGAKGVNASELASGVFTSKLTEAVRKTAYNLGKTEAIYAASKKTAPTSVKGNTVYKGEHRVVDGKISDAKFGKLNDRQKSGLALAKILSKLGANVYVYETTLEERQSGKENGYYISEDGSIHIDLNSGSVKGEGLVAYTVTHEFVHFIEDFSPEKFKKYADILFEELGMDQKSVSSMLTEEILRLREQEKYKNLGESKLRDIAYSEVVAKCSEKIFTDTDALSRVADRLAKTDRTLLQKIVDFFKIIISRLRGDYGGQSANSLLGDIAADTLTRVEAIRDIFADAAVDALQNFRKAESNIKSTAAASIQYSDRSFSSQVDDVLSGADTNSTHLKLSGTPKLLLDAGLPRLPILMTAKHLKKIVSAGGHGIDVDVVKKLPEYISSPVMIADSFTRTDSIVIVTEAIDSENRPVIAAIMLNGVGRWNKAHISANIMTSAYGRNNFQSFLNRLAESESVLYWDKKKSQDLSVSLGVQFPNAITNLDSNTIIRKARAFVNSKNTEFSETLKRRSTQVSELKADNADSYNKNASEGSIHKNSEKVNRESEKSFSEKQSDRYTYDSLVSKPDMKITVLEDTVPKNRADVISAAKKNAAKIGKFNTKDGSVSVYVDDIGTDVVLSTQGLKHGLDRRFAAYARVTLAAGEILKNAIQINELVPSKAEAASSYVLIGTATAKNGEMYAVRFVVNRFSNELASMDVLYAINAKKENPLRSVRPGIQPPVTDSTISIAQLLEYVNRYFPDVLPEDVLKHYGYDARPEGEIGKSALYSPRNSEGESLSREQQAFFKDSKIRDEDGNLLVVYHGTSEKFTVFDRAKGRANMDIQGSFFSPWEIDAGGYGENVGAYYLNIKNPASESEAYRALKKFQGQNNAGVKAREYLESLGYDGVNNGGEEYIAFDSNQIKRMDNLKPTADPDIRYSERSFSSQIDDVLAGRHDPNYDLYVGKTPQVLLDIGFENKPLLMRNSKVKEILSKHSEMSAELIKKIPQAIADPVMIVKSKTNPAESVVAITDIQTSKGEMIIPVWINQDGTYLDVELGDSIRLNTNFVASAYGRSTKSLVEYAIENDEVLYYSKDKKRVSTLLATHGLQLPARLSTTNFTNIISETSENVNRESEKSFSKLSEREDLSNRTLLANALGTVAKNETERQKLNEYKTKIGLMEQEEERLSRTRAKIKELSFAKGARDTEKIRSLQSTASEIEARITKYDRQLFRLEASEALRNVLSREVAKAKRAEAKKYVESLNEYRQKTAETVNEIVRKNRESRKNAIEGRNRTAARGEVKKIVAELNAYLAKNKVLIGMQKVVAEALDAINMDTVGADARVAKYDELIKKTTDPEMLEELTKTRNRIAAQGESMQGKLQKLKAAYADIINSDDPLIANSHDEVIEGKLDDVIRKVGDTAIRDMTMAQLEAVYDLYKMILTSVRQANKAFHLDKAKTIEWYASEVMTQAEKTHGKRGKVSKLWEYITKNFGWDNLKPIYAMRMIGSDTLTELYKNVREGQSVWYKDFAAARDFLREQKKAYGVSKWDYAKKYTFTSESGKTFDMTLEQILSLYAYSKRPQAIDHLTKGGIVFDDAIEVVEKNKLGIPMKYTVNDKSAYRLSEATIAEILNTLTEEQKAYADIMQAYLSEVMGEKGNEVALAMYGVKLFKEKNYFPLKSSGQFLYTENEVKGEAKIKNAGFTKSTAPRANNPIIMSNFTDVWVGHCNEMSMYHAFTLPLEDFNRVWQYKARGEGEDVSVRTTLANTCGDAANTYIKDLLVELNGGVRVKDAGVLDKLTGLAKKGAVFMSASVTIQQPSAICRAMAYISPWYFIKTSLKQLNFKKHAETWEECKKYAPVAGIKEMGYFDTGMGRSSLEWAKSEEYEGFRNKLKAFFKDGSYRDDVLSRAPALADEITWCHIWNATKAWVADTTKLVGEELLTEAGKRFTDVIDLTQVYDSVLSRSANMRNKNSLMKMATAFMAEPTTTANMMLDAFVNGKRTGGAKGAGIVAKTGGAVLASIVLNSLLKAVVYAWRDDDDEKSYLEKYGESALDSFLDDIMPFNYIPVLRDIVSLFQGYDVSRLDMSLFKDLIRALQSIDSSRKSPYRKVSDIIGALAKFFGLPIKNIDRDLRPLIRKIFGAF